MSFCLNHTHFTSPSTTQSPQNKPLQLYIMRDRPLLRFHSKSVISWIYYDCTESQKTKKTETSSPSFCFRSQNIKFFLFFFKRVFNT